ncbi:MAG: biotin--[acetyl-CoA-carboxylase] ligase [Verrucomicrobia bacterium RIFCSPHIGHO2_12_FULL_41_10]|nr:MAG: biotin--[acetyl-CoA-carboxylase] ligase [Verrucomicrobia bacterium RIFCSPHIGHO2_12_FULL_41_10]HLB33632.1 biotin--[acetyl-CoA-carboxylase] ligase [Chthoniobacterales bacterium]
MEDRRCKIGGGNRGRQLCFDELQKKSPWNAKIHFFETVTSTNDVALNFGEANEPEGTFVIAETQTQGRGQFHRPWSSPAGMGLWLSLLLRLPIEQEIIPSLSQIGPVALCDAITNLQIKLPSLHIKEPNDLLIKGKKVAGVLVETRRGASSFAVVGIGLNMNQTEEDFPLELRDKATSLALSSSTFIDRQQLTSALIHSLYERYQQLLYDPQKLDTDWRSRLAW